MKDVCDQQMAQNFNESQSRCGHRRSSPPNILPWPHFLMFLYFKLVIHPPPFFISFMFSSADLDGHDRQHAGGTRAGWRPAIQQTESTKALPPLALLSSARYGQLGCSTTLPPLSAQHRPAHAQCHHSVDPALLSAAGNTWHHRRYRRVPWTGLAPGGFGGRGNGAGLAPHSKTPAENRTAPCWGSRAGR